MAEPRRAPTDCHENHASTAARPLSRMRSPRSAILQQPHHAVGEPRWCVADQQVVLVDEVESFGADRRGHGRDAVGE